MPYQLQLTSGAMSAKQTGGGGGGGLHPSTSRGNVKAASRSHAQARWKEQLRRGCLERAKAARRERLRKSRQGNEGDSLNGGAGGGGGGGGVSSFTCSSASTNRNGNGAARSAKRDRDDNLPDWNNTNGDGNERIVDHTPFDRFRAGSDGEYNPKSLIRMESGDSEENVVDTARALVEQELQRAMVGMHHLQQLNPLDGSAPMKKTPCGEREMDLVDGGLMDTQECRDASPTDHEYRISHEEFEELLNDVTEELEKEGEYCSAFFCAYQIPHAPNFNRMSVVDELLEEEIWEMERAEAMERERLMHQIDDFESWEELEQQSNAQPNTYISPLASLDSPLLTCPICNSSSLMETPHGGITCTNATDAPNQCTFQLDIAHEGLTLNHLADQLREVYEEHSSVCSGILQFRMEAKVGMNMLMATCDKCCSDVVVL